MKIILQRVKQASVTYNNQQISEIKNGYVLLVGIQKDEKEEIILKMVKRILKSKLFEEWKKDIKEMNYEILVLSQFTLFGKLKGKKLDFHWAEKHERAKSLFFKVIECFKTEYIEDKIKSGVFGEHLEIMLVNDGPVTIIFDEL